MESGLKQRLVGAAVLVALAVIFLPMLVQGPAPDSGVSNVPLTMPPAPRGDTGTRDLPLVTPGETPAGGAVGLAPTVPTDNAAPAQAGTVATGTSADPATQVPAAAAATPAQPAADAALPAATAGGDYAVSFGAYANTSAADAVVASLKGAQLPAYREPTTSGGKPAWRVRIGPFTTRAEAESARLRSAHVRDDVNAQVVVLDAAPSTPTLSAATSTPAPTPPPKPTVVAAKPGTPATVVAAVESKAQPKPDAKPATAAPKPPPAVATGFAVQLAAYSKASEATALRDRLRAAGFSAFTESVATDKGALIRVRVGPVANRADAEQLQAQVKAKLGLDGIVRPHP
ncbi:MAG: sporulation protein [Lysobacter sp.]|nr:sporulation protein [Lysobacter sp.]